MPGWENVVFLNRNGSPTKNSAYDTSIHKLCDKIGMMHFGMHAFRHTFATTALASGWPIKDLSKVLGHRDVSTTMNIYVHTTKESVQSNILHMEEYTKEQLAKAIIKMA